MSEANKTVLRRYVDEVWHKRNPGALEKLKSAEFVDHAAKEVRAPEDVRRFPEASREAFPDADVTVKDQIPLP
jgi:hypothetical protein